MGLTTEEQKAVEAFRANVVEPSMKALVILDFWAEWCGPCKALSPVLESVAARYADKGVKLVKINVDEDRFIAGQFQVQSIPTVYAIFQGQPVANLTSARTESQLAGALDQILSQLPIKPEGDDGEDAPDIEPLLAMGEEILDGGDAERAMGVFAQIAEMAPEDVRAQSGLLRAMIAAGHGAEAQQALDGLPENVARDPAFDRVRSALALAAEPVDDGAIAELTAKVEADAGDHEARLELAQALFAAQRRDEAADHLLAIIQADRDWNDGAARTKLLQIFETVGLEDPWVSATRRRLSAILFG